MTLCHYVVSFALLFKFLIPYIYCNSTYSCLFATAWIRVSLSVALRARRIEINAEAENRVSRSVELRTRRLNPQAGNRGSLIFFYCFYYTILLYFIEHYHYLHFYDSAWIRVSLSDLSVAFASPARKHKTLVNIIHSQPIAPCHWFLANNSFILGS